MAIQSRIVNNSFTEIYVGGGNFITQSAPTNFHKFYTRKILTPTENISDYKEVTASERAAIEAADAKWEAPSEGFIAQCEAAGAVYNRATGFFELNGLMDITAEQMRKILAFGHVSLQLPMSLAKIRTFSLDDYIRTNILMDSSDSLRSCINGRGLFYGQTKIEVACVGTKDGDPEFVFSPMTLYTIFTRCYVMHTIIGVIRLDRLTDDSYGFIKCFALKNVQIADIRRNLDMRDCAALSLESITYMVNNATNTSPITITLHPDAYVRLTDELIAEAANKQITFATTN